LPTFRPAEFPKADLRNAGLEELRAYVMNLQQWVAQMQRDQNYYLNQMDSDNISEVGGWRVTPEQLASKDGDVGMSTADTGADDIRFWAGDVITGTPLFYVTKSGKLFAGNGEFVGKITAGEGEIGGFTITADALTAKTGGRIENHSAAANKVYIDETGLHANDASGVERVTLGTTPAKGAKAWHFYGLGGPAAGLMGIVLYDTETVDGASRTGQFVVGPSAQVLLFDEDGDFRLMNDTGAGIRAVGTSRPEIQDGFGGWGQIAYKSEVDAKQDAFTGYSGSVVVGDGGGGTLTLNYSNGILTSVS